MPAKRGRAKYLKVLVKRDIRVGREGIGMVENEVPDWALIDEEEEMKFCYKCRSPLMYVIEESKEHYSKFPRAGENLVKRTWDYTFVCAKCGEAQLSVTAIETPPKIEKREYKCLDCKKKFKDFGGTLPICKACRKKYRDEDGWVE